MRWLPCHLLPLCLIGTLLLYTSSAQEDYDTHDYDVTEMPEYDYNATFDYIFFSNTSSGTLDLEEILKGGHKEVSPEEEEKPTDKGDSSAACCSFPSPSLFHSLLLIQMCWLLCA